MFYLIQFIYVKCTLTNMTWKQNRFNQQEQQKKKKNLNACFKFFAYDLIKAQQIFPRSLHSASFDSNLVVPTLERCFKQGLRVSFHDSSLEVYVWILGLQMVKFSMSCLVVFQVSQIWLMCMEQQDESMLGFINHHYFVNTTSAKKKKRNFYRCYYCQG